MAGFPTSSAWMLLFLQLNAIVVSPSGSKDPCTLWREFHKRVEKLKGPVKLCSEDCSTVEMTVDRKCQCLNLSMSPEDSVLPGFFIGGVKALNLTLPDSVRPHVPGIINKLNYTSENCKIDNISLLQRENPFFRPVTIISPKVFLKNLTDLGEELKVKLMAKSS